MRTPAQRQHSIAWQRAVCGGVGSATRVPIDRQIESLHPLCFAVLSAHRLSFRTVSAVANGLLAILTFHRVPASNETGGSIAIMAGH